MGCAMNGRDQARNRDPRRRTPMRAGPTREHILVGRLELRKPKETRLKYQGVPNAASQTPLERTSEAQLALYY
jgi:hypothetical protein